MRIFPEIIVLYLDKWRMGVEKTIGLMSIFTMLVMAELLSPDRSNEPDKLVHCFLDEAHLYLVDELAEIALSQGRNRGARFLFTYQSRSQYGPKLRNAVEALYPVVFRCSAEEADYWRKEVLTDMTNLINLEPYKYYLRLYDRVYFLEGPKPLPTVGKEVVETVKRQSEEAYGGAPPDFNSREYYDAIFPRTRGRRDITA